MDKDQIIAAIREEILSQGLSNYELAKRSGLRESTLQRFNSPAWGQQIETLCKIAGALGLKMEISGEE